MLSSEGRIAAPADADRFRPDRAAAGVGSRSTGPPPHRTALSRCDAESPGSSGPRWRSVSSSSPPRSASAARMNTRSRRWGAPTSLARRQAHLNSYPHAAKVLATRENSGPSTAGTFSNTMIRGRSARMARSTSGHRARSSSAPFRLPARLNGWQGHPPHKTSTGSTCAQSTAVMSPRFGTPSQRCARTLLAALSFSQCQAVRAFNTWATAQSRAPAPENREPIRGLVASRGSTVIAMAIRRVSRRGRGCIRFGR